jgi:hypothetical protein
MEFTVTGPSMSKFIVRIKSWLSNMSPRRRPGLVRIAPKVSIDKIKRQLQKTAVGFRQFPEWPHVGRLRLAAAQQGPRVNDTRWPEPNCALISPAAPLTGAFERSANDATRVLMLALALPFDTLRAGYATGVQAGIIERSMLANRDFERVLGAVEGLTLGPWARRR